MNPNCMAFTCETDEELAEKWALIPEDTNILVTHSPPLGTFDMNSSGKFCGSSSLKLKSRQLKELELFVFGHIHEGYSMVTPKKIYGSEIPWIPILFPSVPYLVNASHVNERYQPVNKPIRVIL